MAQFNVGIPDASVARVVQSLCDFGKYQPLLPDGTANPQTKQQFAKAVIQQFIIETVKHTESTSIRQTAINTLQSQMGTNDADVDGIGIAVG